VLALLPIVYLRIEDIFQYFKLSERLLLSIYFRKYVENFQEKFQQLSFRFGIDYSSFKNEELEMRILYGFSPRTIEYCLKYDDYNVLAELSLDKEYAEWSPFEWSRKPQSLELLSFSGFFGSVKCFLFLLNSGYQLRDSIREMVICSCNYDLFQLVNNGNRDLSIKISHSIEFFNQKVLDYLIEYEDISKYFDNEIVSPLHIASENGHLSHVQYFISKGVQINAKNTNLDKMCFQIYHYY